MRNGFFGFVAHVGEAEGLAANVAVAGVDDEVMLFAEIAGEFQNINAAIVFHAGECFRAKAFFREEVEAGATDPIVNERVRACMSIRARVEAFLENFVELGLQGVDVRDAGRAWRHPLGLLFFEFEEIKIKTAVRNFFGACKSFFGNGEKRKTRRERERFLRAGEHDVDAERVHVDLDRGER